MANVDRLKQVRMAIVNFEENFHYRQYYASKKALENPVYWHSLEDAKGSIKSELFTHTCDTCACVAGFATALCEDTTRFVSVDFPVTDVWEVASSWLELTWKEADWLFTPNSYKHETEYEVPSLRNYKYEDESEFPGYVSCSQEQGYAEALRRLDHLIEYYSSAETH